MDAYEFTTQIMETGYVEIPVEYAHRIPEGTAVRVLLLIDEPKAKLNGQNGHYHSADSLEDLIAEIKRTPSKPENIIQGDGLLAWRLANPITETDPDFSEATWNQEWAEIEAKMKAASLAHEQEELERLFP
jgi:hypothetical protein